MTKSTLHSIPEEPDDENGSEGTTAGMSDEPINPYSMEALRYDEAEFDYGNVHSKKVITAIKVRKPSTQEWFRLHPGREFKWPTAVFHRQTDEMLKPESWLVLPKFRHLFGKQLQPVTLRLAITSLDTMFLWDMKRSRDGIRSDYHISLDDVADEAERSWVRLEWNNGTRVYNYNVALDDLGDPNWGPEPMSHWVELGYKSRTVDREDHPVVVEFRGGRT